MPASDGSSRAPSPSTPELKDRVVGTIPPANQTSAITNEITIVVGSGPESQAGARREGPDRGFGSADPHRVRLHQIGARSHVDSTAAERARCIGTNPPAGQTVPLDTADRSCRCRGATSSRCPTSAGSSGPTPSRACGRWAGPGVLDKGADVRDSGQRTNAVVTQSPSPGSTVNFDATITLSFAA